MGKLVLKSKEALSGIVKSQFPDGSVGSIIRGAAHTALSAAFPNNYEFYHLALQMNYGGQDLETFVFPVTPESLNIAQRYLVTVTPTLNGSFVDDFGRAPSPIQLSGTFGKGLKTVLGAGYNPLQMLAGASTATGFGMTKKLADFVGRTHEPKSGVLPTVVLYNWAFNEHWEVVINSFDVQMSVQQNGLWIYNLSLTTLRKVENGRFGNLDTLISSAATQILQNSGSTLVKNAVLVAGAVSTAKTIYNKYGTRVGGLIKKWR